MGSSSISLGFSWLGFLPLVGFFLGLVGRKGLDSQLLRMTSEEGAAPLIEAPPSTHTKLGITGNPKFTKRI